MLGAGVALLGYAGLVAWLTWPLAAHLTTHLPDTNWACGFDPLYLAWSLAHQSHALVTAPATYPHGNVFHPTPWTLFYGETGLGVLPYFMPPFLLTGNPTLALNLAVFGSIVLTAWGLHLVVRRWTGSAAAGFVAAWTFLMTPWVLREFVPCAPSHAVVQYLPALVLLGAVAPHRPGGHVWLGAALVLQCVVNVYVAAAALAPLVVLAAGRLLRPTTRGAGVRLLAVLAVAALALGAAHAGHLLVRLANPGLAQQSYWPYAQELQRTELPWGPFRTGAATALPAAAWVVIALGALAAARGGSGATPRHAWLHGTLWAVVGFVAALTPVVLWYGRPVRLPQATVAEWLPVYELLRVTKRLGVASLVGLAVLAGLAFAAGVRQLGDRTLARVGLAALAAGLMYAQYPRPMRRGPRAHEVAPYPLRRPPTASPVTRLLAAGDGPVLELPVRTRGLAARIAPHAEAMYRSIFHWRPLLNGYSAFWPVGFPERMALAERLPDPAALAALRRTTGLVTILVHLPRLPPPARAAWRALAARGGGEHLRLVARLGPDLVFTPRPETESRVAE